jgi:signal transduction histidine kinase
MPIPIKQSQTRGATTTDTSSEDGAKHGHPNFPPGRTDVPLNVPDTASAHKPHHPLVSNHHDRIQGALRDENRSLLDEHGSLEQKVLDLRSRSHLAEMTRSTILSNLSHEFRTPLNAIIGFSEVLLSDAADAVTKDKHEEYINDIRDAGRHLLELVETLLDTADLQEGEAGLNLQPANLFDSADSALAGVCRLAGALKVDVQISGSSEGSEIELDTKRINQALHQTFATAIQQCGPDRSIRVEVTPRADYISVHVRGFDPDRGTAAIKSYTTISDADGMDSVEDHSEKTGFGFSLARTIAEMHGGSLDLVFDKQGPALLLLLPREPA